MDEDLRDLERAWRASRAWDDWKRWARACARSGDPAPLTFARSCERVRVGAKRVIRLGDLARWEHRDRRRWIEELREQAEHVTSQSRRQARRALLELMRRGVSPVEHGAYSYADMSHYAVGDVPEVVKCMQDVLGDPGKIRAIARTSRWQIDADRSRTRSAPPLGTMRCREPGCPVLTPDAYCTVHERAAADRDSRLVRARAIRADAAAIEAGLNEAVGRAVGRLPGDMGQDLDDAIAEGIREGQEAAESRQIGRLALRETSGAEVDEPTVHVEVPCRVCHHAAHAVSDCRAHVLRTGRTCRCPLGTKASEDGPRRRR